MARLHMERLVMCGAAGVLATAAAAVGDPIESSAMYGVNRTTGQLTHYDFSSGTHAAVGYVRHGNGPAITGIDAMAVIPGFQNIFAFHTTSDGKTRLLFVDAQDAKAVTMFADLEGGRITGATAAPDVQGTWNVFAAQRAKLHDPFTVTGVVNLNPNNSPQNEFELTKPDGSMITRDDLHQNAQTNSGTFYLGDAILIRFKPKGNGNQNGLVIAGEPYPLQNSNTYILSGQMQVKVYNDHIKNGKAMGHWWLQIISGTAHFGDQVEVEIPDRLVKVDHKTGVVTELMSLARGYDGLATRDGLTFLATSQDKLYALDTLATTETLVGTMSDSNVLGLEFCDTMLVGFEIANDRLFPIDAATGARLGVPLGVGATDLGSIVFVPLSQDPMNMPRGYD